ncbi:MAG: glutathione synthetase, partial [Saprospiraceae bacterium]|nr:glutathione synthetase [Saprospiraceae bacterium]
MNGYHILMLTDHAAHSAENSLYALASAIYVQPDCLLLDIASRSTPANRAFFDGDVNGQLAVVQIHNDLDFDDMQERFTTAQPDGDVQDYDFIILRLPPPLSRTFAEALTSVFDDRCIINRPAGIFTTGSKEFLLQFPELCPPIAMIRTPEDLLAFSGR